MKRLFRFCLLLTAVGLFLTACSSKPAPERNFVYFWRTQWQPDSTEKAFLETYRVERIYMRFFDVVKTDKGEAMPNATITFADTVPSNIEIVPTVFIVNDAMKVADATMAEKLLRRILQMCETNDIRRPQEIQIDCDWTKTTREQYFKMLKALHILCKKENIALSATIRLHQLRESPPPVDSGVLMLYNTGNVADINEKKPILSAEAVAPYLGQMASYDLPVVPAYPVFSWKVAYREGRFLGILNDDNRIPLLDEDSIVVHKAAEEDIEKVFRAVEKQRKGINRNVILFDLNSKNITLYQPSFYEKIYHH